MSIQRTAQSALHALEELYNAIDISNQRPNTMSMNDSENIVHALCDLSQLIDHINQTGMCGQTPVRTTTFDSNRFNRRKVLPSHPNNYDGNMIMDSATIGPPPQPGQPYGECIVYHPIRIITTGADGPAVLHENDFARKKEPSRKDHDHKFPHHTRRKKNRRRMSRSHSRRSRSDSRVSRSGSRASRMSRQSRRSSHRRASQSHGRSSRSSRRSRSRSSRRRSRHSKTGYRRSSSRGRKSRSSQKGRRRSRSSQRRSRRRSSHKRRSVDQQYRAHPIPSQPTATATGPSAPSYLSNQLGVPPIANQLSVQQPYNRPQTSSTPMGTVSNTAPLPQHMFTPTLPLLPPPAISSLHHSHPPPPQTLMQQYHQPPLSSSLPGTSNLVQRPMTNPLNEQSSLYQQVPVLRTNTGNTIPPEEQPSSLLSSTNPAQTIPSQNNLLTSSVTPLQTTNSIFTSRSDNCPECRAITRLLQWAPLKCYDAAGIRRGVFLAGPKSEQLLKALYSSMKDASLSLDDIEDCICDNDSNK